jgi:hypothetical protein
MSILFTLVAVAHVGLVGLAWRRWRAAPSPAPLIVGLLAATLVADNLVIAWGHLAGEGTLLLGANRSRYLVHIVLTPALVVALADLARCAPRLRRLARPGLAALLWLVLVALGAALELGHLGSLEPVEAAGTLRYVPADVGPPVVAILVGVLALVVGVGIGRDTGRWWAAAGAATLLVLGGQSVAGTPILGNASEIAFLGGLLAVMAPAPSPIGAPRPRSAI